ncbi:Scr1 family TA system antitoxin-like transcriptional regulator [Streptomyces albus]|uniref:Scr1 family TA system antitoxin-like transcriptional regulator n=1 Tax=Streptomyces albus TaxID=1888 RepID=UPI0034532578
MIRRGILRHTLRVALSSPPKNAWRSYALQDIQRPFIILTLAGEPSIDVTWLEHLTGGTLLERREEVLVYSRVWDELTAAALSPAESQRYITNLIKEVANEPEERAVRTE